MARQTLEPLYEVKPEADAAMATTAGLRPQDPVGMFAAHP
jgi:hypothetical protein